MCQNVILYTAVLNFGQTREWVFEREFLLSIHMKDNVKMNRPDFAIIYFHFVYVSESSLGYSSKLVIISRKVLNNHA